MLDRGQQCHSHLWHNPGLDLRSRAAQRLISRRAETVRIDKSAWEHPFVAVLHSLPHQPAAVARLHRAAQTAAAPGGGPGLVAAGPGAMGAVLSFGGPHLSESAAKDFRRSPLSFYNSLCFSPEAIHML